jgi:hypothetical protein
MPEDAPNPLPKPPRPPAPGWMCALFGLGLVPVGVLVCLIAAKGDSSQYMKEGLAGAACGLILGGPMLGGLALAARLFDGAVARFLCGILFGALIIAGAGGVVFFGCVYLITHSKFN